MHVAPERSLTPESLRSHLGRWSYGGPGWEAAPGEVWLCSGPHTQVLPLDAGPEVQGEGQGWCRGDGALAVPRGCCRVWSGGGCGQREGRRPSHAPSSWVGNRKQGWGGLLSLWPLWNSQGAVPPEWTVGGELWSRAGRPWQPPSLTARGRIGWRGGGVRKRQHWPVQGVGSLRGSTLGQPRRPGTQGRLECGVRLMHREPKMLYVNLGTHSWVGGMLPPVCVTLWKCFQPVSFLLQTLKNSKSLCSLDDEDEEEDGAQAELAPYDPRGMRILTPVSSPLSVHPRPCCTVPGPWASWEPLAAESEGGSGEDPSDGDSAGEEGAFPPGRGELDLGQIESN